MNRLPTASSNIASIGYENSVLEIQFRNGSIYQYKGPTAQAHFAALMSPKVSKGNYFAQNVRSDPKLVTTRIDRQ